MHADGRAFCSVLLCNEDHHHARGKGSNGGRNAGGGGGSVSRALCHLDHSSTRDHFGLLSVLHVDTLMLHVGGVSGADFLIEKPRPLTARRRDTLDITMTERFCVTLALGIVLASLSRRVHGTVHGEAGEAGAGNGTRSPCSCRNLAVCSNVHQGMLNSSIAMLNYMLPSVA